MATVNFYWSNDAFIDVPGGIQHGVSEDAPRAGMLRQVESSRTPHNTTLAAYGHHLSTTEDAGVPYIAGGVIPDNRSLLSGATASRSILRVLRYRCAGPPPIRYAERD